MEMALINNIENEYPNRNMGNDFKIPIKVEKPDTYEQVNNANEFIEIEIGNIKVEKNELDKWCKQETLLNESRNIQGENAVKKEENQEVKVEETTVNLVENQNDPVQDMRRNLELYPDHEVKNELVIGPVVLQPQIISGELNNGDTTEDFLEDSTTKPQSYSCDTCDKVYESVKLLKKHVKSHNNGSINKHLLDRHHRPSNKDVYTCNICKKQYKNSITLAQHYKKRGTRRKHTIEDSSIRTISKPSNQLMCHNESLTKPSGKSYACEICNKRYYSPYTLSRHCKVLHNKQFTTYPCRVCKKTYYDLTSLIDHFNVKHQKRYECDICGTIMSKRSNFVRHIKERHGDRESYSCEVCNKQFSRRICLRRHENTPQHYENTRKIKDTTEYGSHQKIKDYKHHMRTDNDEEAMPSYSRRFICDICKKEFLLKDSLRSHIESVHGNVRHSCEICNKTYSSRRGLKRHVNEHELNKRFECDICKKKFSRSWNLQRHKLNHTDA